MVALLLLLRCQCPRRAISILTSHYVKSVKRDLEAGVNALGGLFPFLRSLMNYLISYSKCVNALGGLFPFLQKYYELEAPENEEVSMPSAGYFHSYVYPYLLNCSVLGVNALGGLFPFLLPIRRKCVMREKIGCQCPRRAISILTPTQIDNPELNERCVNALGGLFPFLLKGFMEFVRAIGCVNALGGLFPFLQYQY